MKRLIALGRSFCYAGRGILSCIKNERNMRIHLCASFYVLLLMPFYGFSRVEKAAVFLCIGLVTALEAVNTAVEAATDLISTKKHPLAALAKDAAAGAVLFAAISAATVGITLYYDTAVLRSIFEWFVSRPVLGVLFVLSPAAWAAFIFLPCKDNGDKDKYNDDNEEVR